MSKNINILKACGHTSNYCLDDYGKLLPKYSRDGSERCVAQYFVLG